MVTLYSAPGCAGCVGTERFLQSYKVLYKKIDVSQDEQAKERIKQLGYGSLPVVFVDEDTHWSGMNLSKIREIAEKQKQAQAA